ncbi:hypothetical protein [Methanocaldococcus jannaschii]|nr:hypothetical protein [Methanocaldococcus jannaschii]
MTFDEFESLKNYPPKESIKEEKRVFNPKNIEVGNNFIKIEDIKIIFSKDIEKGEEEYLLMDVILSSLEGIYNLIEDEVYKKEIKKIWEKINEIRNYYNPEFL